MKKFFAILLIAAIMVTLTACIKEKKPTGDEPNNEDVITQEPEKFEELTVVDNEECTIKITGIKEDSLWGYTVNTILENKSAEKTYMFAVRDAAINGVATEVISAKKVAPGKKANGDVVFAADSKLKDNGIQDFTDIEISFRVYDSENLSDAAVAEETVHVYPYGKDKAEIYNREQKDTDNVIVDNENVTIIVTGYDKNSIRGYSVNVFLVNKTDTEVMFSIDEESVNGYMIDPFWAYSVNAGKCAFASISWSNSLLEDNNITEVETIEAIFKARDNKVLNGDVYASENVTLKP